MSGIWAGVRTLSPRGDLGNVTELFGTWFEVVSEASVRAGEAMGNLKSDITPEPLLEWPPMPGVLGAVELPWDRPKACLVGGNELWLNTGALSEPNGRRGMVAEWRPPLMLPMRGEICKLADRPCPRDGRCGFGAPGLPIVDCSSTVALEPMDTMDRDRLWE